MEIDVLVINCSLFSPTPSLCALVISKFGMRSDIKSYNLSGMGCGASLISVDLAKSLLQRKSGLFGGGKALVVSTEIITPNLYHGNERNFLLQNTLFRCGGAAIVLSNKWTDGMSAMYKLLHIVRVQVRANLLFQLKHSDLIYHTILCYHTIHDSDFVSNIKHTKKMLKTGNRRRIVQLRL